jgi:hypothetical protein
VAAGAVDDDLPHGAGGDTVEVAPALPVTRVRAGELQVGFVNELGRDEAGIGGLAELETGAPAELVVDDRETRSNASWSPSRTSASSRVISCASSMRWRGLRGCPMDTIAV